MNTQKREKLFAAAARHDGLAVELIAAVAERPSEITEQLP